MRRERAARALLGAIATVSLFCLASCKDGARSASSRSSSVKSPDCCAAYQHSDTLPDQRPPGVLRLAIGGDSRDDHSGVVSWAFAEAKNRGASAFLFLGDMEITSTLDNRFAQKIKGELSVPLYPVIGNHEIEFFGAVRLPNGKHAVKEFKEDFLNGLGIDLAPFPEEVVYSADLGGAVHFIALDNVSRRHEGFGFDQRRWLETDLKAASAAKKTIIVGMHKGLANNPVTRHAMDEDGANAIADSNAALALFQKYKVAMVFVSHSHMYASYNQDGIEVRLTGGLGAPLVKGLAEADGGFHHVLLLDVPPSDNKTPLRVEVVQFPGTPTRDDQDETLEVD